MKLPKAKKLPSGNWRIQIAVDGKRYSITDPNPKVVKQKAKELYAGLQFEKRIPLTIGKAFDQYFSIGVQLPPSPPISKALSHNGSGLFL